MSRSNDGSSRHIQNSPPSLKKGFNSPGYNEILRADTSTKRGQPFYLNAVSAGFPSPADDYMDRSLDLNEHLIANPAATFFVRACGESMIGAGIHDNDILIVDRSLNPVNGSVVIAALDGELTVKRLLNKNGNLFLTPENNDFPDMEVYEDCSFEIWGVVTYVIHRVSK